jgi:hypothetical protein
MGLGLPISSPPRKMVILTKCYIAYDSQRHDDHHPGIPVVLQPGYQFSVHGSTSLIVISAVLDSTK